jgi:hypothetical protein
MNSTASSLQMPAFPDIATDDFILVTFGKDGSTGVWSENGSSDYTAVTGSPSNGGAIGVAAYFRKATSGSEVPRLFTNTVTDDAGGFVTVWSGVDTTTPLDDEKVDVFGSSVDIFTPTAMTTTANNSLIAWFAMADNDKGLTLEPGLMGFPPPFINAAAGGNCVLGWTIQESSGAAITPAFTMTGIETGQVLSFAITPASSTDAPPYCDHDNSPPSVIQRAFRSNTATGTFGGSSFDPTGTVTDIDGESTTFDAGVALGGGGAGGVNAGLSITYGSSDTGLRVSGWTISAPLDLSSKVLSIQMGVFSTWYKFGALLDKGFVFGLRSGTVDYMFWGVGGSDSVPQFNGALVGIDIEVDGGFEIDEIGTFDPADVTGIVWGGNRTFAGGTLNLSFTEMHSLDRVVALGGHSADTASMQLFTDGVAGNYQKTFPALSITKQKVGIGDGSTPTYWKDDSAVMSAYVANTVDNSHQVADTFAADLEIHASASDTIDLTGQVWKGKGATPFLINASSSASATYVTDGLTIISRAVTFQDVFTAASGISISNSTYTANNADLSGGCTFDNTQVTVNGATQAALQLLVDDHANNNLLNSATALRIEYTGTGDITLSADAITWTGNTVDIHYNSTNASTLTITMQNGSDATTSAISGAAVAVVIASPIVIYTAETTDILAGSRLRVYNVTTATEIENDIQAVDWTLNYTEGTDFTTGDEVNIRVSWQSGATYKEPFEITLIAGAGFNALIEQVTWTDVENWAVDGSLETDWVADGGNIDIDIVGSGSGEKTAMVAWWAYYITTASGVVDFWEAYTVEASNSIRQNVAVVDVVIEKTSVGNFSFTDNDVRYYRSDFSSPYDTTGNSIFMDYSGVPLLIESGVSGLTPTESNQLGAIDSVEAKVDIIDDNVDSVLVDTADMQPKLGTPATDISADIAAVKVDTAATLVDTGTTLPAQIAASDAKIDTVDSNVDSVKAKTDQMAFTVANQVDSNLQSVNDTTVTGTGADGDEWGP